MISLFSSAEKESQLWWHVLSFHLTNWKFMQFDRNSSRFYEIFTWSGMTPSSLVLFFIGQSQFHAFKLLSALIFSGFRCAIPRNISYVFFFLTPLCRLWSLRFRNSTKISNSGSPLHAIFLLTNWFEEPIEVQDLLHIVDGRCQLYGNHRYCGVL